MPLWPQSIKQQQRKDEVTKLLEQEWISYTIQRRVHEPLLCPLKA